MKKRLEDIMVLGADWTVRKINPNDPEIQRAMAACRKAQAECAERKKIDPLDLLKVIEI